MAGSSFGNIIRVTTWGESHGAAVGCVIDGFPAGMEICEEDIQKYLDLRKPGQSSISTPRKEDDKVKILSGVFEGKTTGTPISLMVENTSQHSADYNDIAQYYRPGHADYSFDSKYGFRDYRGGGRSSGRETIGRVAAGALCLKFLKQMGIEVMAYTRSIGKVYINEEEADLSLTYNTITRMPDLEADKKATELIDECKKNLDSVGGSIGVKITGVPAGIGDPVFNKLDALLADAVMGIGAVKAVEIGDGIKVSESYGSTNNDAFEINNKVVSKKSNHSGGILGGMSDGSDIILRAYFKPTPSIARTQQTFNKSGENIDINIKGRHDPVIMPRAVIVVQSMAAITLLDAMLVNMPAKAENVLKMYTK
ncbi:MAG: chorismate synthase [Butyrivibrio sp.]|nr:chorismate synthase [Butyrivibrio sp.]